MIEVDNLVKRYGRFTAVDHVSFRVDRGEVLGFLGPNGAGKTTTMRVITGYLPADGGRVRVGRHDVAEAPVAAKELIGYLPEGAPLYDEMKVVAFLKFVAAVRGLSGAARDQALDRIADTCELRSVWKQPVGTLSKGYCRRVCFAQALIHDPDVLIMDEPTDGLDPNQKHDMRQLIRRMGEKKAIIISTHILEEVDAACSRVAIIDHGRLVFDGVPKELRRRAVDSGLVDLVVADAMRGDVMKALRALPVVDRVQCYDQANERVGLHVFPKPNSKDLLAAIGGLCRRHGWTVVKLHSEAGRLDNVFRQLTLAPETPAAEDSQ